MTAWTRTIRLRGISARVEGRPLPLSASPTPPSLSEAAPVRLPGVTGATPAAISDAFRHLTVIIAIDDSGSTQPPHGTDPYAVRYAAAHAVTKWMRRQGGGQIGVVHWGSTAPARLAVGPVPVNRRMRTLRRALNQRPNLGWTVPAAALRRAARLLPAPAPDQTQVVLILTDAEDCGDGLAEAIGLLPEHAVHVLIVGDGTQDADWEALPFASITRLPSFDNQALALSCGAVLAGALGLRLRPPTSSP
ncbi:VWA domain-containing protein [Streptomyces sp. NPDC047082]|uniref:VWA domain-containing protein n=1 Tax=Streptomyces sp. NPDC047082 TaxID=3155259 RepID=UPI0033FF5F6E